MPVTIGVLDSVHVKPQSPEHTDGMPLIKTCTCKDIRFVYSFVVLLGFDQCQLVLQKWASRTKHYLCLANFFLWQIHGQRQEQERQQQLCPSLWTHWPVTWHTPYNTEIWVTEVKVCNKNHLWFLCRHTQEISHDTLLQKASLLLNLCFHRGVYTYYTRVINLKKKKKGNIQQKTYSLIWLTFYIREVPPFHTRINTFS